MIECPNCKKEINISEHLDRHRTLIAIIGLVAGLILGNYDRILTFIVNYR